MNPRRIVAPLVTPVKVALLTLVFLRFHSWTGAFVVLVLAALMFASPRAARRWMKRTVEGLR